MSSFMDEVVRPYVIWMLWPQTDARSIVEPKPPMTAAKIQMIEASKSPMDETYEQLVKNMEGDIATRKQVTVHVKRAARALGFDQIEGAPQNAVRRIWRQMGSLKPEEKNGYRLQIDTVREEITAIRGSGEWISKLSELSREDILGEMKQNSDKVGNLKIA